MTDETQAFVVCPVRGVNYAPEFLAELDMLAKKFNIKMHFPPRDTKQDDPIGFDICLENRKAIEKSDVVIVYWDGKSQGVLFDLGMAFMAHKPIAIVDIPEPTEGKSFQNMLRKWEMVSRDGGMEAKDGD